MNETSTNASLIRECTLIISMDAPDLDTSFVHWGHNSNDANTINAKLGESTLEVIVKQAQGAQLNEENEIILGE